LHLLNSRTGNRKTHLEPTIILANLIEQQRRGRPIALTRNLLHDRLVRFAIEVKWVGLKYGIPPQAIRLVNLKVEAD
jgi:hypothetical protein